MSENSHEIDELPQLKPINIFETKETIINKTKFDYTITQQSLRTILQNSLENNRNKTTQSNLNLENNNQSKTAQFYFHCRNCLLIISHESNVIFNN
jgi:hypothetical protein